MSRLKLDEIAAAREQDARIVPGRVARIGQKTLKSIRCSFGHGRSIIDRERGSMRQQQDLSAACGPI